MRTAGNIFGIVGLVMFCFGIVSYVLTHTNSLFFYVHTFGGLTLLLLFFILTFKGTKEFLGLMLLIILALLGCIISGTVEENLSALIVFLALPFITFIAFNLDIFKRPKRLSFLLVPAVLVAAGVIFKKDIPLTKNWILILGGCVLLGIAQFSMNFAKIKEGVFGKSTKYAVNVLVYSVVFLLIIIVLNILGYQVNLKKDLTENKINTLSEQSVKILKNLKNDVNIKAFFVDNNREKDIAKQQLELYTAESKKVKVEFIDPDLKPQAAKLHNAKDGDIVIECEGEETTLTDFSEEALTSAIIRVSKTVKPLLCFTSGHGEMKLDDEEQFGLSAVAGGIKNEGYETKTLESILEGIPVECDVLIVAGPSIPFIKREAKAIKDYLDEGGKGLFMLDPRIPDTRLGGKIYVLDTGLENLAKESGVKIGKNFILERHLQLFSGMTLETSVQARNYASHPIVDPLKGKVTLFPKNVRSLQKIPTKSQGTVTEIILSDPKKELSWAENDIDSMIKKQVAKYGPGDIEGPVPLAVAVEEKAPKKFDAAKAKIEEEKAQKRKKTRSVWVGNSFFVSNSYVRSMEFNYDLFLNMLSWLWGAEEKISIRPKRLRTSTLLLTPEQSNIVFYVSVLAIPEIILVFGLIIWLLRRKK